MDTTRSAGVDAGKLLLVVVRLGAVQDGVVTQRSPPRLRSRARHSTRHPKP
jgi:hypothetical protein